MTEHEPTPERHEHEPRDHPRIYVADLAAYNNGHLHGTWIDSTLEPGEMWEQINAMLGRSPIPGSEEIAIHDYEHFGPLHLSEYESIGTVSRIGRGFLEHGHAFLHWVDLAGTSDPDELDAFEDHYLGQYESLRDLGEEMADAHGIDHLIEEHLPEFIRPYVTVDYEAFGADMASDCHVADEQGGIHVFSA